MARRKYKPSVNSEKFHKILDMEKWELWAANEIISEDGWKHYKLICKKERTVKANFSLSYNGERMAKGRCYEILTTRHNYQTLAKKTLNAIANDYHR